MLVGQLGPCRWLGEAVILQSRTESLHWQQAPKDRAGRSLQQPILHSYTYLIGYYEKGIYWRDCLKDVEDNERPTGNTSKKKREQMGRCLPERFRVGLSLSHCSTAVSQAVAGMQLEVGRDAPSSRVAKKQQSHLLSRDICRPGQGGRWQSLWLLEAGIHTPTFWAPQQYSIFSSGLTGSEVKGTGTWGVMPKTDQLTALQGWRLKIISFDLKKWNGPFWHAFFIGLRFMLTKYGSFENNCWICKQNQVSCKLYYCFPPAFHFLSSPTKCPMVVNLQTRRNVMLLLDIHSTAWMKNNSGETPEGQWEM